MNEQYTLVVIDMQPFFTKNPLTVANVEREVRAARASGMPVIVLEIPCHLSSGVDCDSETQSAIVRALASTNRITRMKELAKDGSIKVEKRSRRGFTGVSIAESKEAVIDIYHPTHPSIMKCLDGYDRHVVLQKFGQGGSVKILNACRKFGFGMSRFRIVGVNIDLCVLSTVKGLLSRSTARVDVVKDACDTAPRYRWNAWVKFPVGKRLAILEAPAQEAA